MIESKLAQIALQGPFTMQNWKKYAISEDLCVWHVLGICDRFSKMVRFANAHEATGKYRGQFWEVHKNYIKIHLLLFILCNCPFAAKTRGFNYPSKVGNDTMIMIPVMMIMMK